MTYYRRPSCFPVSVGLVRSCRWRLRTHSLIVLLCCSLFWWMWAMLVACLLMVVWPAEAIVAVDRAWWEHQNPRSW